jgi:hypothetical protein
LITFDEWELAVRYIDGKNWLPGILSVEKRLEPAMTGAGTGKIPEAIYELVSGKQDAERSPGTYAPGPDEWL